ncbi:MAG: hypothetical protein IRY99_08355, partial [Isosphaeraceae bacterium]|nr:hypothetical protein [Isosphaeraceae bacterium]
MASIPTWWGRWRGAAVAFLLLAPSLVILAGRLLAQEGGARPNRDDMADRQQAAEDARREAREILGILQDLQQAVDKERPRPKRAGPMPRESVGLVPLTELGTGTYQGKPGGLYPGGSNRRPSAHEEAGLRLARAVRPLDREGRPADDGKIVLLSIGMSNTTQEFSTFVPLANADPQKNPALVIVDGAQGGMAANVIAATDTPRGRQYWETINQRLSAKGVTPQQVQVAWIKQAIPGPTAPFPEDARALERYLE